MNQSIKQKHLVNFYPDEHYIFSVNYLCSVSFCCLLSLISLIKRSTFSNKLIASLKGIHSWRRFSNSIIYNLWMKTNPYFACLIFFSTPHYFKVSTFHHSSQFVSETETFWSIKLYMQIWSYKFFCFFFVCLMMAHFVCTILFHFTLL